MNFNYLLFVMCIYDSVLWLSHSMAWYFPLLPPPPRYLPTIVGRFCAIASCLTRHFNKTPLLSCVSFFFFQFLRVARVSFCSQLAFTTIVAANRCCARRNRTHTISMLREQNAKCFFCFKPSNERGIEDNAIRNVTMTYVCLHTRRHSSGIHRRSRCVRMLKRFI